MNRPSNINFIYLSLIIPGELIIDFISSFPECYTFYAGAISLIPIYLFTFGFWQLLIAPIYDKYGVKIPLVFHLLLYIIGCILSCLSNPMMNLIGKLLEIIGAASAQVAYYDYLCNLNCDLKSKILVIHKSVIGLVLLFVPLISNFTLNYNLLIKFNFIYILLSILFIRSLCKKDELSATHKLNKQKIIKIYISYFKSMLSKEFIYFSICIVISQLLLFSFYSHPLFYFEEKQYVYDNVDILIYCFLYLIFIFFILNVHSILSIYKANLMYAILLCICALKIEIDYEQSLMISNGVMYFLTCGSLLCVTSNMSKIVSQDKSKSSKNVTLVGLMEALSSSVTSLLYFRNVKLNLQQYSMCLYVSGLIIILITIFSKINIIHE